MSILKIFHHATQSEIQSAVCAQTLHLFCPIIAIIVTFKRSDSDNLSVAYEPAATR
jgi:K+ transporter